MSAAEFSARSFHDMLLTDMRFQQVHGMREDLLLSLRYSDRDASWSDKLRFEDVRDVQYNACVSDEWLWHEAAVHESGCQVCIMLRNAAGEQHVMTLSCKDVIIN